MGYRGRIINPFLAELARLDVEGTRADPDGAGPLTSGYDPVLLEPLVLNDGSNTGSSARVELPTIKVRCQIEHEYQKHSSEFRPTVAGNSPRLRLRLIFHFRDLEQNGLVDPTTKQALIRVGDRLVAIWSVDDELVEAIVTPPGLYVVEAQSHGFGFSKHRNLLVCTFDDRMVGPEAVA